MLPKRILIHIGYPKTGTTWLQKVVFCDDKAGFIAPWGGQSHEAIAQFAIVNSFRFDSKLARGVFEPGLSEAANLGLVPVSSHEALSGNPTKGKYWSKEVADRIYAAFPEARILLVIREQKSMIMSWFAEYIKGGGTATIQKFLDVEIKKPGFRAILDLEVLEFDLLIAYYQNLFGSDNILVLPFELLKQKPQDFGQSILSFAGADGIIDYSQEKKNIAYKAATLNFRRRINFLTGKADFSGSQPPLTWRIAQKLSITFDRLVPPMIHKHVAENYKQFIAERVGDSFRESNQRTSCLINTNLADFGYDG